MNTMRIHGSDRRAFNGALRALVLACIAGLCVSASSAMADEPALGGPKVEERNVPGVRGSFGEEDRGRRGAMGDQLPPQALRRALESVIGPEGPEATRATPEQLDKIESIVREHEQSVRAYMQQHREEIGKLRREAGPRGNEGDRPRRRGPESDRPTPPAGDDMMDESDAKQADPAAKEAEAKRQTARDRMREIQAGAPKLEDAMTKVWSELNETQRQAVDERLDEVRERISQERQERYVDQRVRERGANPPGGPDGPGGRPPRPDARGPEGRRPEGGPPPGGPGRGERISPERHERLIRLFEQLSPEQQEQLLRRMEERAQQLRDGGGPPPPGRDGARPGRGGDRTRKGPKPPPDREEIRPPAPEDIR